MQLTEEELGALWNELEYQRLVDRVLAIIERVVDREVAEATEDLRDELADYRSNDWTDLTT